MLVECIACGQMKHKEFLKKEMGTTRFVDEHGNRWNGKTCPPCKRIADKRRYVRKGYNRNAVKEVSDGDELLGPSRPLFSVKQRPCKRCNKLSPNYRYCTGCLSVESEYSPYTHAMDFCERFGGTVAV